MFSPKTQATPTDVVNAEEKALTFSELSQLTGDFANSNDPYVKQSGAWKMNTLLFFGGFVNEEANFAYYTLKLREKSDSR